MFIKNTKDFTISNHEWNFIKKDVLKGIKYFSQFGNVYKFINEVEERTKRDNKPFYILTKDNIYFLLDGICFLYNFFDPEDIEKFGKKITEVIRNYDIWENMKKLNVGLVFFN